MPQRLLLSAGQGEGALAAGLTYQFRPSSHIRCHLAARPDVIVIARLKANGRVGGRRDARHEAAAAIQARLASEACPCEIEHVGRVAQRDCALMALSVDSLFSHFAWLRMIRDRFDVEVRFPILEDPTLVIGRGYGMVAPGDSDSACNVSERAHPG